jgi:hypothetical protein
MTVNFPWRSPESGFLGYNHSILQITIYLLGLTPAAFRLATGIKLLLLLPLGLVSLRCWLQVGRTSEGHRPPPSALKINTHLGLDLAFAFYAGAMIWLDIVWEMTLGIVIFAYLLATLEGRTARSWCWLVFLPYALLDIWQVASFAVLGQAIIADGFYIWTDPSIYLPLVKVVILVFYALLIKRLWLRSFPAAEVSELRLGEAAPQRLG